LLITLRENFYTDLHEIFTEGWQWAIEQMVKFWWRSGSMSGYRDCFPDSSLLGDTERGKRAFIRTDSPDDGNGKTCPGGGMQYPNACSLFKQQRQTAQATNDVARV